MLWRTSLRGSEQHVSRPPDLFTAWHISVRSHTVGAILTGFMTGGMAMLWEEALAYFSHYYHREEKRSLRKAA